MNIIQAIRLRQEKGIPESIREKAKLHILDTLAISFAAYKGAPIARKSISSILLGSGGGRGRILGSEQLLPPAYAAFANTVLAHALDYDDINDEARIHPTPIILAASLAAADLEQEEATDLVAMVALGNELLCRLGYAIEPKGIGTDSNWFLSQLFGYIGAAITAGLVLRLDDSQMAHAIGLAYMQAAGGKEAGVGVGSEARSIYPAFASMGGVQAAFLARGGVTAPLSSLDGKTGLFPIYFGKNLSDTQRNILLNTETWAFSSTSIKLYPSCRYSHSYIKSALLLREDVRLDQVEKIIIGVNETARMLCQPLKERCYPQTLQDAKFSIPFMVAFAFVHGRVDLNNLTESALHDSLVLRIVELIEIDDTQPNKLGLPLGDITCLSSQGVFSRRETIETEVTFDVVYNKFLQCCYFSEIEDPKKLWRTLYHNMDFNLLDKVPIFESFGSGIQ
ncbi:2-methylcitrate dehydratase PrpD [Evansella vedderi]|uniref:2-methylcitrate dehydratase PrpD n=1 Tax=Evansella vedderi TaxID=38282 RepID=A0ABU0A0W0_9BACI|nr:MmgE/PrpD family protein [Evansella vedderi]MDQ0257121.1 2-methylcitrate dehydratase PrpD [Evansella vedderi]